ncbi:MFS transporter [Actinomadura sp. NBRC 104412]|uniref:MFS transporter n=1 Tax=Actinomadura sp. NBRC 104412 TaxID=3032203 RepID=UPI0024A34022|nr:MFS transporter [Actinomadura sp. NBRC 104412]GLZ08507.1 MFS transporter [Actinomadura sp. NBRC 104412]
MSTVLEYDPKPAHASPAPVAAPPVREKGILGAGYRGTTLGVVLVITLMGFEAMSVGTVMPVIARDLDGLALYAWGFSATLIAGLPANVLAGTWADRSGPARPLLAGVATFVLGLVIAGAAPGMWTFVAGRAVQGLGTGIALVATYVLIARVYPERLHPRVFAALSAAWVLPTLIGPTLGGVLTEQVGWRFVFLGLIPLVIPPTAMLIPAMRGLGTSGEGQDGGRDDGRDGGQGVSGASRGPRAGRHLAAVTAAVGTAVLLYGLDRPGWAILPIAAAGLAGLGVGLPRLLPPGTLRMRRGLPSVVLARGLLAGAFFGTDVFIPLALTSLHDFTPTQAGVALMVASLGWSAASQIQGRSQRPRDFYARLGAVLILIGTVTTTVALHVEGWLATPTWIIGGVGMGFAYGSLSVLLLSLSPKDEQGANSSALQIADSLGSSLVIGVAGALAMAFGTDHLGLGLGVAGTVVASIAALGVLAAFRLRPASAGERS